MFHKFKKGSPEAKAFMDKLRAMRGKKRKKNPYEIRKRGALFFGKGKKLTFGTKAEADRARKQLGLGMLGHKVSEVEENRGARQKRNPPLLILGNPKKKRRPPKIRRGRTFRKANPPRFGPPPKGLPGHIWSDPDFQAELKCFRKRHGSKTPVHITPIKIKHGEPKFMTAWGRVPEIKYDAMRGSIKGKRVHKFGEGGGTRPFLASSKKGGRKFLRFVGGTYSASGDWIHR